ncbi:hypothetical protein RIVM261_024910 [Rivularia sp. IAM M-261]|nr:hypothetical protein CAL7716_021680 [Calothrix sp. PCC 7716]GJD17535.1 hypothetical protein RIVM261_024910 [Rivularia sp. IAM M-261]
MYYLYLDAFLFACPKSSINIQEFEEYLNSLIKWGEEIDNIRDAGLASIYLSLTRDIAAKTTWSSQEMENHRKLLIDIALKVFYPQ